MLVAERASRALVIVHWVSLRRREIRVMVGEARFWDVLEKGREMRGAVRRNVRESMVG